MTLNKIDPRSRNLNSTSLYDGVPVKVSDVNPIIEEVNSQDTRITTLESTGNSRIIASLENVNLKTIAANTLTWASGKTAANTAPTHVVVTMAENDTYADDTTVIKLTLDGDIMFDFSGNIAGQTAFSTATKCLFSGLANQTTGESVYSNSGDWALPVTQGTLNDFRVNIYILGDTI